MRFVASVSLIISVLVAAPAESQTSGGSCFENAAGVIVCTGQAVTQTPGKAVEPVREAGKASPGGGAAGPVVNRVSVDQVSTAPDGSPCVRQVSLPAPAGTPDGAVTGRDAGNIFAAAPAACPSTPPPAGGGGGAAPQTPQELAVQFWHEIPLPAPRPTIAPGRAITGKTAYLETRGELHHVWSTETPNGTLTIDANGSYSVDWGDGAHGGPYPFEGAPWPDGRITHTYVHAGAWDVVVTEHWTATWVLGGDSGTLDELRTTGRIEDFPAQQIQAVRER